MAGSRYYLRRIKYVTTLPPFQLVAICLGLLAALRWVILHNHDPNLLLDQFATLTISVDDEKIDWSKLYYVQYATSAEYLCNALMIWSEIEEIGSRAQRIMMYPSNWNINETDPHNPGKGSTPIARLLQSAQNLFYVQLAPIDILHENRTSQPWVHSYTKLLAFNLTSFDRVLALEPDSVILQNLDELFLFPSAPVAMPYEYKSAEEGWGYSSQMMLIQPSAKSFLAISKAVKEAQAHEDEIGIVTRLYRGKILRIPQRPYNLLTSEFRQKDHTNYLMPHNGRDIWDSDLMLGEAKVLQFSDQHVPKPWFKARKAVMNKYMPQCHRREGFGATDCRDRTIWLRLYKEFEERRKAVCGPGFEVKSLEEDLAVDKLEVPGQEERGISNDFGD